MGIYSFSGAISEIKYYQRYEMHEEALEIATKVDKEELDVKERITLYKLMAMSYRKIESGEYALIYINRAISLLQDMSASYTPDSYKKEFGVLLMNKGVVFHSESKYNSAVDCYTRAISLFKQLTFSDHDLLVNAYISIGEVYIDMKQYFKSLCFFRCAEDELSRPEDVRRGYIQDKISDLEKQINNNGEVVIE